MTTLNLPPAGHGARLRFLRRALHRWLWEDVNMLLGPPWVPKVICLPADIGDVAARTKVTWTGQEFLHEEP